MTHVPTAPNIAENATDCTRTINSWTHQDASWSQQKATKSLLGATKTLLAPTHTLLGVTEEPQRRLLEPLRRFVGPPRSVVEPQKTGWNDQDALLGDTKTRPVAPKEPPQRPCTPDCQRFKATPSPPRKEWQHGRRFDVKSHMLRKCKL